MRFSASTTSALAAALLVKEAVAGHAHRHRSNAPLKDARVSVVTDEFIETIIQTVYVTVEWPPASSSVEPTTTTSVTTTISISSTVKAPSSSASPVAPVPVSPPAAVVVPTTLVPVNKPKPTTAPAPPPAPVPTTQAPAPAPVPTTAAAIPPTTPVVAAVGKKGVPYNSASLVAPFVPAIAWAYNWDSSPDGSLDSKVEYVPMLWSDTSGFTKQWKKNAQSAISSGSTHLLAFNEPDLGSQSNLAFTDAASSFMTYMQPFAGSAKLVGPAVTNGGGSMGLTYLENFMSTCKNLGCTIDAVAIHWYGSANNLADLKTHVTNAFKSGNKDGGSRPIWLTEFAVTDGSDSQVASFISEAVAWLDAQPFVERYAYFMASQGVLVNGNSVSNLGKAYIS